MAYNEQNPGYYQGMGRIQRRITPLRPQPSVGCLTGMGCLGAIIGGVIAILALAGLLFYSMTNAAIPVMVEPNSSLPDVVVTIREQYFSRLLAQSLPENGASNMEIDVHPDNRISVKGRMRVTIFGQAAEGDWTAAVVLQAQDGQLATMVENVEVFGFALPDTAKDTTDKFLADIDDFINEQIRQGLGDNAYIMGINTDEDKLVVQVRFSR